MAIKGEEPRIANKRNLNIMTKFNLNKNKVAIALNVAKNNILKGDER